MQMIDCFIGEPCIKEHLLNHCFCIWFSRTLCEGPFPIKTSLLILLKRFFEDRSQNYRRYSSPNIRCDGYYLHPLFVNKESDDHPDTFQRSTRSEDRVTYLNLKVDPFCSARLSLYFDVYHLT